MAGVVALLCLACAKVSRRGWRHVAAVTMVCCLWCLPIADSQGDVTADGGSSLTGWEWEQDWGLDRNGYVDGEGWAYFTGTQMPCACKHDHTRLQLSAQCSSACAQARQALPLNAAACTQGVLAHRHKGPCISPICKQLSGALHSIHLPQQPTPAAAQIG